MRSLIVSLHDVSPFTRPQVENMLQDLQRLGVPHCSLLVIPNHHHRGVFTEDPDFCSWLSAKTSAGCEPVIHGYYHQRERRRNERVLQKLITRVYTAGEGEFYDISQDAASTVLAHALADFRRVGLDPSGFVAPAWLLSREGEKALRRLRFRYTTRLSGVWDLANGVVHQSQSLVYSVRNAWRRAVSMKWNALLFECLRNNPLLRISLHPGDIEFPHIWRDITHLVTRSLADRVPLTYESWLNRGAHAQS
jgi:uncharacterized protein